MVCPPCSCVFVFLASGSSHGLYPLMVQNHTFSGTLLTRLMARPMWSARPTRPTLHNQGALAPHLCYIPLQDNNIAGLQCVAAPHCVQFPGQSSLKLQHYPQACCWSQQHTSHTMDCVPKLRTEHTPMLSCQPLLAPPNCPPHLCM